MVWGRDPHPEGALVADLSAEVRMATGQVEVAEFDPDLAIEDAGTVLAATVTGGFDPKLYAITDDAAGIRHVVSEPVPDDDPAEVLADILDAVG